MWSGEPKQPNHGRVSDRKTCRTRRSIRLQAIYMSGQKSKNKVRRCRESVNRCERARTKIDKKTEDSKSQVARSWPPHSVVCGFDPSLLRNISTPSILPPKGSC